MYPNESPKKALAKIGDKEISVVVVSGQKSEYKYQIEFDVSNISSEVYFFQISAGNFVEAKKMVLMK